MNSLDAFSQLMNMNRKARRAYQKMHGVKIPGLQDKSHYCCWEGANPHRCAVCCKCDKPLNK